MLVMILVLAVIFGVGYIAFKPDKMLKEPLYRKYKANPFTMRTLYSPTRRYCSCSICKKDENCREYSNLIRLCWDCEKKIESTEILKEQGIPLDVMRFNSQNLLYILNLVQIDLQQGNITESDAKCITNETAKEMIENATYYKRAKKAAGGKRLIWKTNSITYKSGYETTCLICGRSWDGAICFCDSCYEKYERELKAKKFPNKLKETINKIYEIYPSSVAQSYTYDDWRYLNLIAKDLERGFIEKPEALSEAERYIDLIYNDIKNVPEELATKLNAPLKPREKTESEKFMDDILS